MRILVLNWKDTSHPLAGGAEVFTEKVAKALAANGHEVTLHAAAVAGRPGKEERDGFEIVRGGGRLGVYRAARRFWRDAGGGERFDVVVDEINTRPFLTPRWLRGAPVAALIHQLACEIWSYETPFPVSTLGRHVLEPWWLRAYRDVPALTVSESSAESLRRLHGWRDVTVVPEGHGDVRVPDVPKEPEPTVVFLGRLVGMKRPEHAIEAFRVLAARRPSAQLWVIGDGPLLGRLRADAPEGVRFLGRLERDDVLERLARAHVLVATSVREGWGLNVSEAALCGTPAMGYRVPGLVDSIPASGGALVDVDARGLGSALADFFTGRLELRPTVSTVPWSEVADAFEEELARIVERDVRH